jgi:predicted nucleic acid-binding protein
MRQDVVLAEALDAPLLTGDARLTGASGPERETMLIDAPR